MSDDAGALLARLTRQLARSSESAPLSLRLCRAFTSTVVARGGSISVGFTPVERMTLCITDDIADFLEGAQDVLREGPSFDAFRTGVMVTSPNPVDQSSRWPMLADMVRSAGHQLAMYAYPLRPQQAVIGVLLVHDVVGHGPAVPQTAAQFLADAVGVALLGDLGAHSVTEDRWSVRDRIDQATGMVIAQLGVPAPDALAVLRAHAFAHGASLAEVSEAILSRDLDFGEPDVSADGSGAGS